MVEKTHAFVLNTVLPLATVGVTVLGAITEHPVVMASAVAGAIVSALFAIRELHGRTASTDQIRKLESVENLQALFVRGTVGNLRQGLVKKKKKRKKKKLKTNAKRGRRKPPNPGGGADV